MKNDRIQYYLKYDEFLNSHEFLNLLKEDMNNIKSSVYIPPKLGDKRFGVFKVTFKKIRYETRVA